MLGAKRQKIKKFSEKESAIRIPQNTPPRPQSGAGQRLRAKRRQKRGGRGGWGEIDLIGELLRRLQSLADIWAAPDGVLAAKNGASGKEYRARAALPLGLASKALEPALPRVSARAIRRREREAAANSGAPAAKSAAGERRKFEGRLRKCSEELRAKIWQAAGMPRGLADPPAAGGRGAAGAGKGEQENGANSQRA